MPDELTKSNYFSESCINYHLIAWLAQACFEAIRNYSLYFRACKVK